MKKYSIAIDGPSGAGKSTLAKILAEELGFIYVDTGAMYRACALYCMDHGIDGLETLDDLECIQLTKDIHIELTYIDGEQQVLLNGKNVTKEIRHEEVGNMASNISTHQCIRQKLVQLQRDLAEKTDIVMDGRDIGSNVLPDATLKVYLTASEDVRARRRYEELDKKGIEKDFYIIKEEIIKRDYRDMNREHAPLIKADDAIEVNTSDLSLVQVKEYVLELFREKRDKHGSNCC